MIRILLADDNMEIRHYFRSVLDHEPDFEVIGEAESGAECIRLARQLCPDIILMDIQMEDETAGITATLGLKERKGWTYRQTAAYGHFGREGFPWEATDKVDALLAAAKQYAD